MSGKLCMYQTASDPTSLAAGIREPDHIPAAPRPSPQVAGAHRTDNPELEPLFKWVVRSRSLLAKHCDAVDLSVETNQLAGVSQTLELGSESRRAGDPLLRSLPLVWLEALALELSGVPSTPYSALNIRGDYWQHCSMPTNRKIIGS